MSAMPGVLIGVDVGCTTISGGLVTADGAILSTVQVPTRLGSRAAMEGLLGIVATLRMQAAERGLHVEAVGVGLPGLVDADRGVLLTSAGEHVADLRGNIAERIEAKTGLPTLVDNDANALALGEWRFGLARGSASCVVLAIGTRHRRRADHGRPARPGPQRIRGRVRAHPAGARRARLPVRGTRLRRLVRRR